MASSGLGKHRKLTGKVNFCGALKDRSLERNFWGLGKIGWSKQYILKRKTKVTRITTITGLI